MSNIRAKNHLMKLRKEKGYSQKEMAEDLLLTTNDYREVERLERCLYDYQYSALLDKLEVTHEELTKYGDPWSMSEKIRSERLDYITNSLIVLSNEELHNVYNYFRKKGYKQRVKP